MSKDVSTQLTDELFASFQNECFVTLATIDHETGAPNVSAISWVYAPNPQTIRFAVDVRSRIVQNIRTNGSVVVNIITNGSCFSIAGTAKIVIDQMEDVPLKLARIDLEVQSVRDVMFYGARISVEPVYEKTYDAEAAARLDQQVLEALKA